MTVVLVAVAWLLTAGAVGLVVGAVIALSGPDCCPHAECSDLDEPVGAVRDPETGRVWVA